MSGSPTGRGAFLVMLFAASALFTAYGSLFAYHRVRDARAVVAMRHAGGEGGFPGILKETVVETIRGSKPGRSEAWADDIAAYDRAVLEDLKREGVDLEFINEIRVAMRTVFNHPDPAARSAAAEELLEKFGLEADVKTLEKLDRAAVLNEPKRPGMTERMRKYAASVAETVASAYDGLGDR